ncbi:MAG: glucose-1-phosphate adenylyltransferase [Clostridiales Family XIII bacterium]|jgi:glucose-1-phosphate adenylyltransferase|nr:glucose-1-phosphate adenylyltransferase [Clostridiales Family XIII bacterium]
MGIKKKCVAMLLAGGQGSRLGALTAYVAKPAVSFGGKYKIIDFSLSNCIGSGIDTVGVLTQYRPMLLNSYIGTGEAWDLNETGGGVHILPPYLRQGGGEWYKGTANAVFQNLDFISSHDPEQVLILSGDHIYTMQYNKMLSFHVENKADITISVMEVPWEDAHRFGILTAAEDGRITSFSEKPQQPESNLASMGIYIFNAGLLENALTEDEDDPSSSKDFGHDVIPRLLNQGKSLYAYRFSGYWKDVGTIESYYSANMELLQENPPFNIFDRKVRILSNSNIFPPQYIWPEARVENSLICNGCSVKGTVINSILSPDVRIEEGSSVIDSIILPGTRIGRDCTLRKAIVGENTLVGKDSFLGVPSEGGGAPPQQGITVVADSMALAEGTRVAEGENVNLA